MRLTPPGIRQEVEEQAPRNDDGTVGRAKPRKRVQTSTAAYHGQQGKKNDDITYHGQKAKAAQTSGNCLSKAQESHEKNQAKLRQTAVANEEQREHPQVKGAGKPNQNGKFAHGKPFKPQHFNLAKQPNTAKAPRVKFQQGRRIAGKPTARPAIHSVPQPGSEWHDQNWWRGHYRNNITFVFGAPYYWNAGYWFPAWGYNPNAYYAWDGPIYAYNRLPPDQVIANVQSALQQQGYYRGEVDGLIGPLTRGAIADYQRDHGLYATSTIDQPTLQSLGMT